MAQSPDRFVHVDETVMCSQVVRVCQRAVPVDVVLGGAQDEREGSDLLEPDARIRQVPGVQCDVEAAVQEVVGSVRHAAHLEAHGNFAVRGGKRGDRVADVKTSDPLGGDDAQASFRPIMQIRDAGVLCLYLLEDASGEIRVAHTWFGESHGAGRAIDESHTDLPLQFRDVTRNERTRGVENSGGRAEAAELRDSDERAHQQETVHGVSPLLLASEPYEGLARSGDMIAALT